MGLTDTHLTNSLLRAGLTDSHQARSLLRAGLTDTHLTNSLLRAGLTDSHQARSLLRVGLTDTHLARSLLRAAITRTHQAIALLVAVGFYKIHQTTAALTSAQLVSQDSQALVRKSQSKSHATNGNKLKLSSISSSSGGYLKKTGLTKKLAMLIGIGDGPPLSSFSTTYDQSLLILYNDGSNGFVSTPFRTMRNPSGNLLPGRKEVYYDTQYKQWIAIANDFSSNRVYTSNNGVDWVKTTAGRTVGSTIVVSSAINDLSYGNGNTVLAVQGDYAGTNGILSYNGTSWTTTWPSALESGVYGTNMANIAFLNGKFLAYTNANLMATSTDGVTWTSVSSPFTGVRNLGGQAMCGLATDGSYFYAIGTDNASHYDSVYKSSDGINWSLVNSSIGLSYASSYYSASLKYFNGYFRTSVLGLGGYYSSDLINWTSEGSYVPIAYDYYSNTVVASDGGYAPGFGYKQIGTLYKASSYAGIWTALPAVSGIDGIGIGAAGFYGADTLNMITNMLTKITSSKSHNTSALFRSTFFEQHNTSSFFKAAQSKTQQTRALLKALLAKTHNTNALLRDTFSENQTTNVRLRSTIYNNHNVNSLKSASISRSHNTEGIIGSSSISRSHNTDGLLIASSFSKTHQSRTILRATFFKAHNTNVLLKATFFNSHETRGLLKASDRSSQNINALVQGGFNRFHDVFIKRIATGSRSHHTDMLILEQLFNNHASASLLKASPSKSAKTDALKIANIAKNHYVDVRLRAIGLRFHLVNGLVRQTFNPSHTTQATQTITPLKPHNTSGLKISISLRAHNTGGVVRNSYDLSQVLSFRLEATNRAFHTTFTRLLGELPVSRQHYNNSVVMGTFAADHSASFLLGERSETSVHYATALLLRFNEAVVRNVFNAFRTESVGKFIPFVVDQQRSNAAHTNKIVLRKNGWGIVDIAAKQSLLNNNQVDYKSTCSKVDVIVRVGDSVSPDIRAIWGACLDNIDHSASTGFDAQDLAAPGIAPQLEPVIIEPPKPRQRYNNVNISPIHVKRGPEPKVLEPAPIIIQRAIQDAPAPVMIPKVVTFGEVKKKFPPPKIWKNTEKILKMPR